MREGFTSVLFPYHGSLSSQHGGGTWQAPSAVFLIHILYVCSAYYMLTGWYVKYSSAHSVKYWGYRNEEAMLSIFRELNIYLGDWQGNKQMQASEWRPTRENCQKMQARWGDSWAALAGWVLASQMNMGSRDWKGTLGRGNSMGGGSAVWKDKVRSCDGMKIGDAGSKGIWCHHRTWICQQQWG